MMTRPRRPVAPIQRAGSLLCLGIACALAAALIAGTYPAAARASEPSGFTGCYAVRQMPADGGAVTEVLDDENAERLFTPASVTKLVTVMAALELLGPGHRVVTEVQAHGPVRGRALAGDLVLVGAGDPSWSLSGSLSGSQGSTQPLVALAAKLAESLDRVDGDLVLDVSRFPGRDVPPTRAISEIAYAYGAPTGALALDRNVVWLRIAPGPRVGEPSSASWESTALWNAAAPYRIDNRTVTAPESRHERGTFDVLPSWDGEVLVLRGEYPISEPPYRLPVALHDGERKVGDAFRKALADAGVEVAGRVRLSETPVVASTRLAAYRSPPLSDGLGEILEDSDNWLAEMLLRRIALHQLGEGRTDDGAEHVVETLTDRAGLAEGALELEDGSGLSPYDLATPRAVVELLLWARTRPWWPVFQGALPGPGNGTLAAWPGLPASMRAKTGTLRHTVALAGTTGMGAQTVTFACFVNHSTEERPVLRRRLARRVAGW